MCFSDPVVERRVGAETGEVDITVVTLSDDALHGITKERPLAPHPLANGSGSSIQPYRWYECRRMIGERSLSAS
jgi:hypothetical protein